MVIGVGIASVDPTTTHPDARFYTQTNHVDMLWGMERYAHDVNYVNEEVTIPRDHLA